MCRGLTTRINLVDILQYDTEFNSHLMALHSLSSVSAWGVTDVQIKPFCLRWSYREGVVSFAAPCRAAWDTGSHQVLSVKELDSVFLDILLPMGDPNPRDVVIERVKSNWLLMGDDGRAQSKENKALVARLRVVMGVPTWGWAVCQPHFAQGIATGWGWQEVLLWPPLDTSSLAVSESTAVGGCERGHDSKK